jgi:cobalt-precorrin-5B (C1)-methyltransferase
MIGKLSKMADGKMMTHAAGSEVNMGLLAELASEAGARAELVARIRTANTARHALELCAAEGCLGVTSLVCQRVAQHGHAHAGGNLQVHACLVDFDGSLLGRYPPATESSLP